MLWGFDKSKGSNWVSSTDGRTKFDHKGCWKNDDSTVMPKRCNPLKFINKISEAKNNKEWYQSTYQSVNKNVFDVFEELFFFKIVATRKYHWRQKCQEKEFFIKLKLRKIV